MKSKYLQNQPVEIISVLGMSGVCIAQPVVYEIFSHSQAYIGKSQGLLQHWRYGPFSEPDSLPLAPDPSPHLTSEVLCEPSVHTWLVAGEIRDFPTQKYETFKCIKA